MSANEVAAKPRTSAAANKVFIANSVNPFSTAKATPRLFPRQRRRIRQAAFRHPKGNRDRQSQDRENDEERNPIGNREMPGDDHFRPDKEEDEREPGLEIDETIHHPGEKKIERTQPENGAD